jgi:hypothetical protein
VSSAELNRDGIITARGAPRDARRAQVVKRDGLARLVVGVQRRTLDARKREVVAQPARAVRRARDLAYATVAASLSHHRAKQREHVRLDG